MLLWYISVVPKLCAVTSQLHWAQGGTGTLQDVHGGLPFLSLLGVTILARPRFCTTLGRTNCYPAMALCCCNRLLRKKGTAPKVIWKILVYTIIMVYATDVYYDFIFRNITWRRTCILLTYFLLFLCSP